MKNRLLAALTVEEEERLLPHMERVALPLKQLIFSPDQPIEYIYFPINGIISVIAIMENGQAIEVGTVGNEGMVGIPVLLSSDRMPFEAFAQIPGEAMRIKADVFKAQVLCCKDFHTKLQRYAMASMNQLAQLVACNCLHTVEERFSRWMLMTQDRVGSDKFLMTHEFLSEMLGVRRASVSVIAGGFKKAGLIDYSRGEISILDRPGLEAASCECYQIIKDEFDRLLN